MNTAALVTVINSGTCVVAPALGNYGWIVSERRKPLSDQEKKMEDVRGWEVHFCQVFGWN